MSKLQLTILKSPNLAEHSTSIVCTAMIDSFTKDPVDKVKLFIVDGHFGIIQKFFHTLTKDLILSARISKIIAKYLMYPLICITSDRKRGFYHICDHSDGHLVNFLPTSRTGIYCHDLDTFRSLIDDLEPLEPQNFFVKLIAPIILAGLKKASIVFCSTNFVKNELINFAKIPEQIIHVVPLGVRELPNVDTAVLLGIRDFQQIRKNDKIILLVANNLVRKRCDLAYQVFERLARLCPDVWLVHVNNAKPTNISRIEKSIQKRIIRVSKLSNEQMSALYARTSMLIQTSTREGFCLPVIEAMASGVQVLCSDIAVLREVCGNHVKFCASSDPQVWADLAIEMLEKKDIGEIAAAKNWVTRYNWDIHAASILSAYKRLEVSAEPRLPCSAQ